MTIFTENSGDAPADSTTPYAIAIGDSFQGTVEAASTRDWIAIDLTLGQRIIVTL